MSWDNVWEKIFSQQEWGKYPAETLIRFVARNFYKKNRSDIKILEVGCGPGANIWYMSREGFDVYGIDGSKSAITQANHRLNSERLHAKLEAGDIESLPYPNNYFDAVVDNECLAHNSLTALETIFSETKRVLKKEGLFYSRTFTDETYKGHSYQSLSHCEFNGSTDGPFGQRGFFRLINREAIDKIYGKIFDMISVDKLEYTNDNETWKVSEWIIICRKGNKNE